VSQSIEDGREFAGDGVVVVLRVVCCNNVHIALEQAARLGWVVCAVDPGVVADCYGLRELELCNFGLDCWV
jgi:hypothetical protein